MWIYLNNSFLSIVKPQDIKQHGVLLVRARIMTDIEQLFPDAEIIHTPLRDYPYRALIESRRVGEVLADLILTIGESGYNNFKQSIKDNHRHDIYSRVWSATRALQYNGDHDD